MTEVEVVVVGGGPVGTATALELHRMGREVLLIDAGASAQKICGEGVLPLGWSVLQRLGVAEKIRVQAPIRELAYQKVSPDGRDLRRISAKLRLPSHGVSREELSRALAETVEESGLTVWRQTQFRHLTLTSSGCRLQLKGPHEEAVSCRLLVGADGLHSRVREQAGLHLKAPRRFSRWGTRVYFRSGMTTHGVTVTLGDGLESYLTPLGDGLHGLALLWSPDILGRPPEGEGPLWKRLLDRFPEAYRRTLPEDSSVFGLEKAIGPLQQRVSTPLDATGRVALVGDASGYLDALTGEGLCLGLAQAQVLARLVGEGRLERYPMHHRLIKLKHHLVVNGLLRVLERPALREFAFATLYRAPWLFQALIRAAVEVDVSKFLHRSI